MQDLSTDRLSVVVREIAEKARRFKERGLNEQNTKNALIEPILDALGWNTRDPDEVSCEFRRTTRDSPVDYSLMLLKKPRIFLETKGLGVTLADPRWIKQILGYASSAGVVWCVLTDGEEYRFYDSTEPVPAEEKLCRHFRLSEVSVAEAVGHLSLISRASTEKNLLDNWWRVHSVDRLVQKSLKEALDSADLGIIRLLRKRLDSLTPKQIAASRRRLRHQIEIPNERLVGAAHEGVPDGQAARKAKRLAAGRKAAKTRKDLGGVSLKDLITEGILTAPTKLFRKYKGQLLEARLLPDGNVEFQGKVFEACSTAAIHARSTVVGKPLNTNGWDFWQYTDGAGKKRTLSQARAALSPKS